MSFGGRRNLHLFNFRWIITSERSAIILGSVLMGQWQWWTPGRKCIWWLLVFKIRWLHWWQHRWLLWHIKRWWFWYIRGEWFWSHGPFVRNESAEMSSIISVVVFWRLGPRWKFSTRVAILNVLHFQHLFTIQGVSHADIAISVHLWITFLMAQEAQMIYFVSLTTSGSCEWN